MIAEFDDVLSKSQYDISRCKLTALEIKTTAEVSASARLHIIPFQYRSEFQRNIDQLLAAGIMIESDAPWTSAIILVKKKDGSLRLCLDL